MSETANPNDRNTDSPSASDCSHASGTVIERGVVNGMDYRVWRRRYDGKKFVYVGDQSKRHNMKWLKKQKRLEETNGN